MSDKAGRWDDCHAGRRQEPGALAGSKEGEAGQPRPAVQATAPVSAGCSGRPLGGCERCCAALRFTKTPSAARRGRVWGGVRFPGLRQQQDPAGNIHLARPGAGGLRSRCGRVASCGGLLGARTAACPHKVVPLCVSVLISVYKDTSPPRSRWPDCHLILSVVPSEQGHIVRCWEGGLQLTFFGGDTVEPITRPAGEV